MPLGFVIIVGTITPTLWHPGARETWDFDSAERGFLAAYGVLSQANDVPETV